MASKSAGIGNITNWVRRRMIAEVNKALRDIGKFAALLTENAVAEVERDISAALKAGKSLSDAAKAATSTAKKAAESAAKAAGNAAHSAGKRLGL